MDAKIRQFINWIYNKIILMVILNVIRSGFFRVRKGQKVYLLNSSSNVKALKDKLTLNYVTPKKLKCLFYELRSF